MSYLERNRERVSYGIAADAMLTQAARLGRIHGKLDAALIYLDCGDWERTEAKLREAKAIAEGAEQ